MPRSGKYPAEVRERAVRHIEVDVNRSLDRVLSRPLGGMDGPGPRPWGIGTSAYATIADFMLRLPPPLNALADSRVCG